MSPQKRGHSQPLLYSPGCVEGGFCELRDDGVIMPETKAEMVVRSNPVCVARNCIPGTPLVSTPKTPLRTAPIRMQIAAKIRGLVKPLRPEMSLKKVLGEKRTLGRVVKKLRKGSE
jgi:hypothetical protein